MNKTAILFFAPGTEEIEALTPCDLLRRVNVNVIVCGASDSTTIIGSHNIKVECDTTENEIDKNVDFDMVIIPGGLRGSDCLSKSKIVNHFLSRAINEHKFIASICASPGVVLGQKGILKGKKATCYPGFEEKMIGAEYVNEKVVVDDNIITSKGAGTAVEFSLELVRVLFDEETKRNLANKILWG